MHVMTTYPYKSTIICKKKISVTIYHKPKQKSVMDSTA
jgi:hypothetical protein